MGQLVLATLVFLATHFAPATPLRAALVRRIGERAYLAVYSIVALATIFWMVWAYNRAPFEPLWQVAGFRLVPLVVMPFSLILIAAGLMGRNPTAVGQESALKATEPARGSKRRGCCCAPTASRASGLPRRAASSRSRRSSR